MSSNEDQFDKIMQFLTKRDNKNRTLGIQLLKSSRDPDLLIRFLSDRSYISGLICYSMVPFFQKHPDLWKKVKAKIPSHRRGQIKEYLPHKILDFPNPSVEAFCELANEQVKLYYPEFPELSRDILTEHHGFYCGGTSRGKAIQQGIGWSLHIESRDVGPAEVIHEEEWRAIAHHPKLSLKLNYYESGSMMPKTWLEELANKE